MNTKPTHPIESYFKFTAKDKADAAFNTLCLLLDKVEGNKKYTEDKEFHNSKVTCKTN